MSVYRRRKRGEVSISTFLSVFVNAPTATSIPCRPLDTIASYIQAVLLEAYATLPPSQGEIEGFRGMIPFTVHARSIPQKSLSIPNPLPRRRHPQPPRPQKPHHPHHRPQQPILSYLRRPKVLCAEMSELHLNSPVGSGLEPDRPAGKG